MPRKTRGESFVTSLGIVGRGEAAASELGAAAHACTPRKTRGESCVTSFGDSKSGVLTDSAARGGVRGDGLPTQLIAFRASVARPDDDKSRTFHRRETKDEKLFGACAPKLPGTRVRTVREGPVRVPGTYRTPPLRRTWQLRCAQPAPLAERGRPNGRTRSEEGTFTFSRMVG